MDEPEDKLPRPTGADLGLVNDYFEGVQKYLQFLKQTADEDFTGIHVALDCAHGATSSIATHLFADLDADVSTMGTSPNGLNINDGVGSTHPEALSAFVKEKKTPISALRLTETATASLLLMKKETSSTVIRLCTYARSI